MVPADDQAMALPWTSVIVIMVLLNVAFTWATPELMFLRSRRRTRVASLPILDPSVRPGSRAHAHHFCVIRLSLLFLPGDRPGGSLAGTRIGMRALAAHRQSAAMPQAAVAAEIHQPLDVELHLTSQVPLDQVIAIDHLADVEHLLVGQLRHPAGLRDPDFLHDFLGLSRSDPMDILQCDDHAFVGRNIDTSDAGQSRFSYCRPSSGRPSRSASTARMTDSLRRDK